MGTDWRSIDKSAHARAHDLSGRGQNKGIFAGITDSVNQEKQTMRVHHAAGEKSMPLPMPFESNNSWIRCIPESSSRVLLCTRSDTGEISFLRYLGDGTTTKLDMYGQGLGLYRPLLPGEIEIKSSGHAETYWGARPVLEQRAGVIRSWLDQDRAEAGAKAPTHVRTLWENASQSIGDEERFGAVKRPISLNPANAIVLGLETLNFSLTSYNKQKYPFPDFSLPGGVPAAFGVTAQALATASEVVALTTGTFKIRPFAKEYLRVINNPLSTILPQMPKLIDIREGQVFEDSDNPLVSLALASPSGQALGANFAYLRARYKYYTTLGDSTDCEIDELGDINWKLSLGAINGFKITVPLGPFNLMTGQDFNVKSLLGISMLSLLGTSFTSLTTFDVTAILTSSMTDFLSFSHTSYGLHSVDAFLDATFTSKLNFQTTAGLLNMMKAGVLASISAPQVQIGSLPNTPCVMGFELMSWLLELITALMAAKPMGNLGYPVLFATDPALVAALTKAQSTAALWLSKTILVSP
jgi:hypothetical protein